MVLPSRIPETESDSSTSAEMSASRSWRIGGDPPPLLADPPGEPHEEGQQAERGQREAPVEQEHRDAAASTVVTLETIEVAVLVTTLCTPPMSFAIRDWISPVRVRVKKASESRCRCR